jgi:tetratricopeptide (TPR) repeat protein
MILTPLVFLTLLPAMSLQAKTAPKAEEIPLSEKTLKDLVDVTLWRSFSLKETRNKILHLLKTKRGTPIAEVLAQNLITIAGMQKEPGKTWKAILDLSQDPKIHGLARLTLRKGAYAYKVMTGKFDEAIQVDPSRDFLKKGWAIGPFGGRDSNFTKVPFGVETGPIELSRTFRGRFGQVRWRKVQRSPGNTSLTLAPHVPDGLTKGCQYGFFQLSSNKKIKAFLELRTVGSFEAWWNGQPIRSVNRRLIPTPLKLYLPIGIAKGWNHLLVKTTTTATSSIALRICDSQGNTLKGLSEEEGPTVHDHGIASAPSTPFLEAKTYLEQAVNKSDTNKESRPFLKAMLALLLGSQGEYDRGLQLAKEAFSKDPKDSTLRSVFIQAWSRARHIPSDLRRTAIRKALDLDDDSVLNHRFLFRQRVQRLYADDQKEAALRLCKKGETLHPEDSISWSLELDILSKMGWRGSYIRVLNEILANNPHSTQFILKKVRWLDNYENTAEALALLQKELQDSPGRKKFIETALGLSRQLQKDKLTRDLLRRIHWRNPKGYKALKAFAEEAETQGRYADALALADQYPEEIRKSPSHLAWKGDILFQMGRTEEALKAMEEARLLDPERQLLREQIAAIKGADEFPEFLPFRVDGFAEIAAFTERPEDRSAPSTLLIDQMLVRVYRDGSFAGEVYQVRRINDQKGIEMYKEDSEAAGAEELLDVRTIHKDGTSYAPHLVKSSFQMPQMEPGCFLLHHYRNYQSAPREGLLDFTKFYFQSKDEPFRFSRLVVLLPKDHDLGEFVLRNFPQKDVRKQEVGDLIAWIFEKKDMPRLETERYAPPVEKLVPWVTFGKEADIQATVRSRRMSLLARTYPFLEIREKAAELCKGKKGDLAQAKAIHTFVNEHCPDASQRPGSPDPVSVLLKGEGERFFLEVSLLRARGIPWTSTLIHPIPPEMDNKPAPLFDPNGFWVYPAVRVEPRDGPKYWLMPGIARYYPFGKPIPKLGRNPLGGSPALLLEGDSGTPIRMPKGDLMDLAQTIVKARLRLQGSDGLLEASIFFPGLQGFSLKEALKARPANVRKIIAQRIAGQTFPGFRVQKAVYPDLQRKGTPLKIELQLLRRDLVDKIGNRWSIPPLLPPMGLTRSFGGRPSRKLPMDLKVFVVSDYTLDIDPGDFTLMETPKGLLVRKFIIDFATSIKSFGKKGISMHRRFFLLPGIVEPDRYQEFLATCRKIDESGRRRIYLRK